MKEWAREILLDGLTADRPPTLLHLDAMIAANEAFSHHPYSILLLGYLADWRKCTARRFIAATLLDSA